LPFIQLSKASFRQTPVVSVITFRGQDRYFPLLPNIHILYYPGEVVKHFYEIVTTTYRYLLWRLAADYCIYFRETYFLCSL